MRCAYCNSLFETSEAPEKQLNVLSIKKGGMEIEDGADVGFNGKILLIKKSDDKVIELAKKKLKNISN